LSFLQFPLNPVLAHPDSPYPCIALSPRLAIDAWRALWQNGEAKATPRHYGRIAPEDAEGRSACPPSDAGKSYLALGRRTVWRTAILLCKKLPNGFNSSLKNSTTSSAPFLKLSQGIFSALS